MTVGNGEPPRGTDMNPKILRSRILKSIAMALVCSVTAVMFAIVPLEPGAFGRPSPDLRWATWLLSMLALFFWIRPFWLYARHHGRHERVDGLELFVRATFNGIAGVPLIAIGKNNLAPYLRLGETHVVFGMFRSLRPYDMVELADIMILPLTNNLILTWKGGNPSSFTANVVDKSDLIEALRWLRKRKVSLGYSAKKLLRELAEGETGIKVDDFCDPSVVRELD